MNINYYKKIKKIILLNTKKNFTHHKCRLVHGPHFADQNAWQAKMGRTGPLCHP